MSTPLPHLVDQGPLLQETGLVHRVLEPPGPGPYPTVVMLHGRRGDEDVMWLFNNRMPAHWLKIAPRGIVDEGEGRYSWVHREHGTWPDLNAFDDAVAAVFRFIDSLTRIYNTDPERLYLMGFSQGAATAYATAIRHPGLVKAIAGLVGFVPEDCARPRFMSALKKMPIFMAIGKNDPVIPFAQSAVCAQTLRMAGANLTYREYDAGHKLNAAGMQDLQQWWMSVNS